MLDLGANIGLALLFRSRQLPNCSGTAFEPDPSGAAFLERCLSANAMGDRWRVVRACAGTEDGVAGFLHGPSAVSRMVESGDQGAIEVSVHDVLGHLGRADLAKLDIEGAEWQVLMDPRFRANAPPTIIIEYHVEHCPRADPREAMLELLAAAGYTTSEVNIPVSAALPTGQGVVWGWREN